MGKKKEKEKQTDQRDAFACPITNMLKLESHFGSEYDFYYLIYSTADPAKYRHTGSNLRLVILNLILAIAMKIIMVNQPCMASTSRDRKFFHRRNNSVM